jgi:primary-amine oxidase
MKLPWRCPIRCVTAALLACLATIPPAAAALHPLDPLDENEIIGAATILLDAGAARPGAIFQSVELREPSKDFVLGWHAGRSIPRSAQVFFRQDRKSYRTKVDLVHGTFTSPVLIAHSEGELGLTIQEVSDFSFAFGDPAFRAALARRGLTTQAQLAQVLVTPLTPGSFGLPEEARRIVKAQMYYTEGEGINLYARPIEVCRLSWTSTSVASCRCSTRA